MESPMSDFLPQIDPAMYQRYNDIVAIGRAVFADTALLDPKRKLAGQDIANIVRFLDEASPTNSNRPWRLVADSNSPDRSTYANWDLPGGPREHIDLATMAAPIIVRRLKLSIDQSFVAAVAALHDIGRLVTHEFATNDAIGQDILTDIGVRQDIIDAVPDGNVMLTPPHKSMQEVIDSLTDEAFVVRVADEHGKRVPNTMQLYLPIHYNDWDRQAWAASYMNRPSTGHPAGTLWRSQIQIHVDNVPRYFAALDSRVRSHSSTNLEELATQISAELAPRLRRLN
jgi:hypothetical protein